MGATFSFQGTIVDDSILVDNMCVDKLSNTTLLDAAAAGHLHFFDHVNTIINKTTSSLRALHHAEKISINEHRLVTSSIRSALTSVTPQGVLLLSASDAPRSESKSR